jgi:hypothetical protein
MASVLSATDGSSAKEGNNAAFVPTVTGFALLRYSMADEHSQRPRVKKDIFIVGFTLFIGHEGPEGE